MSIIKKVKILKEYAPSRWYKSLIGKIISVIEYNDGCFQAVDCNPIKSLKFNDENKLISKSVCQVVDNNTPLSVTHTVKIIKANYTNYWYSDSIDKTYNVQQDIERTACWKVSDAPSKYIKKDDCEIVGTAIDNTPKEQSEDKILVKIISANPHAWYKIGAEFWVKDSSLDYYHLANDRGRCISKKNAKIIGSSTVVNTLTPNKIKYDVKLLQPIELQYSNKPKYQVVL